MHPSHESARAVRDKVSEEEWTQRVDLAAAYRLVALYGWDDLVFTQISAKIPDSPYFLVHPCDYLFEEITASSLVKIDIHGEKVMASPCQINSSGFLLHSAIHEARPDAHCVLHLHTDAGVAVSCQQQGLLPISQHALFPGASLAYHDYEGIALAPDEKERLVRTLADKQVLILRNRGTLTVGTSVADAFLTMYMLERACRIQALAFAGGNGSTPISHTILTGTNNQADDITRKQGGPLCWPGLLRKLDRLDPSYRH